MTDSLIPPRAPGEDTLLIRAARGEQTERTPVWLMRQAGRSDPAYLEYRDGTGLPLEDLFRHPEHAAHITMLPARFGVDGLIIYQDILTPLSPLGAHFVFDPGPKLTQPIENAEDVYKLRVYDVARELGFVRDTFAGVVEKAAGQLPVLGFAGAPFTLAVFMLEGGSFRDNADRSLAFFENEPRAAEYLLEQLTAMTIAYLQHQIQWGAVAVQLFESAAFVLPPSLYQRYALPAQQAIFSALKGMAPTILFARDYHQIPDLAAAGADILSLPAGLSIPEVREALGPQQVVQGNVDNKLVVSGPPEAIVAATEACLAAGQHHGHIFNLSHGLLRETPFEHVRLVVDTVRAYRANEA